MAWDFFIFTFNPNEATNKLRAYFEQEALKLDSSFFLSSLDDLIEIEDRLWQEKQISTEELYEKLGFQEILYYRTRPLNDAICQIMMTYLETYHQDVPIKDGRVMLRQATSIELASELCEVIQSLEDETYKESIYFLSKDEQEILIMYALEFRRLKELIAGHKTGIFLWEHSF